MSGAVNGLVTISSDAQGLHGVALEGTAIVIIDAILTGFPENTAGNVESQVIVGATLKSFYDAQVSADVDIEVTAFSDFGYLGETTADIIILSDITSGHGVSGEGIGGLLVSSNISTRHGTASQIEGIVDVEIDSVSQFGFDGSIDSEIDFNADGQGTHAIGAQIEIPIEIGCLWLGLHGQGSTLPAIVRILSNTRGGAYPDLNSAIRFGHIDETPIVVSCSALAAINSINADVVIRSNSTAEVIPPLDVIISALAFGQTGGFLRDGYIGEPVVGYQLQINSAITGIIGQLHRGSITAPITISATVSGRMVPQGTINSPIPITPSIQGQSTTVNSLFGFVPIEATALGASGQQGGLISTEIAIAADLRAGTDFRRADITSTVPISITASGAAITTGFTENPISIKSNSRARSFLPSGEPVPQSFRNGTIESVIEITATLESPTSTFGIVEAEFSIVTDINSTRGQVLGRSAEIAATIVVQAFLSDTLHGVTVTKIENSAVVYDLIDGIAVAKIGNMAVTGLPDQGVAIGKSVIYAVIAPSEEQVTNEYNAILFF